MAANFGYFAVFSYVLFPLSLLTTSPLAEQFRRVGYVEIFDENNGAVAFDTLYVYFDELTEYLHNNPISAQKLYIAKERFIRSHDKNYYSTDFFGFFDESHREGRGQVSFYYSTHFHEFICSHYPELNQAPEIGNFLKACGDIQQSYQQLVTETAAELGLETIFSAQQGGRPPILLKVIKYLSSYRVTRPHYDGTAFSLFLDSTDNQSLLLAPYRTLLRVDDFSTPLRKSPRGHHEHSILLVPGALLAEFGLYPTPHIVVARGTVRYATVAFAMRPNYTPQKNEFAPLPVFAMHYDSKK